MIKTITLGKQKVKLDNTVGWTLIYRDQFGRDIVPSLMPLLMSVLDVIGGIIGEVGTKKSIGIEEVANVIGSNAYVDAMVHLSGLEITDVLNITWAMAKNANEDLDDPNTWVRGLDTFPLDEVGPVLFDLITRTFMSSKNLKRLQTALKTLGPSTSTQSFSQDSKED